MTESKRSVAVDAKDSNAVEQGQFGDEHGEQRHRIHAKVILVVLCVETREEKSAAITAK